MKARNKYDLGLKGPDPKNSCRTCWYWKQGIKVSHNHCHAMGFRSKDRRANGRRLGMRKTKTGFTRELEKCRWHTYSLFVESP